MPLERARGDDAECERRDERDRGRGCVRAQRVVDAEPGEQAERPRGEQSERDEPPRAGRDREQPREAGGARERDRCGDHVPSPGLMPSTLVTS